MKLSTTSILAEIKSPKDVQALSLPDLQQLCQELRSFLIRFAAEYGGHFGANMGTVELTVALHYVFDMPYDKLIWDVGHQAYCHKLLTGRQETFHSLRTWNGLSGFPKRAESRYDAFGTGHSSTSISAALGMAMAANLRGQLQQHIAIIGDGACTAGLAFEALNQLSEQPGNVLVILNDNNMAIDPNVGGLQRHIQSLYRHSHDPGTNWFEQLSIPYYGPIDGHTMEELIAQLQYQKSLTGPRLLHCQTIKGKGYPNAEKDPTRWHAPSRFNPENGQIEKPSPAKSKQIKYQDIFGQTALELAQQNTEIVAVTPAMLSGSSLTLMQAHFPQRVFDVGIAEQHAVTFSAGLAAEGFAVFCCVYSSFMQRAYDQAIHDVCLQQLPVIFCLDRAGLVGADGATHHGSYDLAYMRCLPNIVVSSPMDPFELRNLLYTFQLPEYQRSGSAFVVRYPRAEVPAPTEWPLFVKIPIGKGRCLRKGNNVAFLSIGPLGMVVSKACDVLEEAGLQVAHYDMRFVKPLDLQLLIDACECCPLLITIEDGCLPGGFGSAVLEALNTLGYHRKVVRLGLPDHPVEHGDVEQLYKTVGLTANYLVALTQELVKPVHRQAYGLGLEPLERINITLDISLSNVR